MGYVMLAGAITAEVAATTTMKYSDGFNRLGPSLVPLLGYVVSFALLAQTLKSMSIGTAYPTWAGIGTAAVAAIGLVLFGERRNPAKVSGIVLNLGGAH
ncbi:DMT family transporter [Streptomyces viridosporus]|uniref:DMT family transporter n=1 Tax=Streptomyces viridosporus TaxID=67581 RepID=UPI0036F4DDDD